MNTVRGSRASRIALLCAALLALACAGRSAETPMPADCPAGPALPRMVRVTALGPNIREEIRYATADNFTGAPLPGYEVSAALLRPAAAEALGRVAARLRERGYGLLVWDAYRPVRGTLGMVEWAERTGNEWVLDQGYVARRSNHNRGNTVDLTVVSLDTGRQLGMGTPYDHFGVASHTANASWIVAAHRRLLVGAMAAEGWVNYDQEWWHYTHPSEDEPLDMAIGCWVG